MRTNWRCCKFNKITQNTLLFFTCTIFIKIVFFSDSGVLLVVRTEWHTCVGRFRPNHFPKLNETMAHFFFFHNEINETHARTHTSAKRLNEIVAWTIKILSGDSLKRLPRISLLNYYCSSILAFIVDLPTDFLVDSIVILCNDFLLPTSFFPLTPCHLSHFFSCIVQQSMKSRTTDIFCAIFQNKLFTFWMEWKPGHRLNQPLIYLHKSKMQECI